MRVAVITPPEPVVTLAEAKRHLKVSGPHQDLVLESMVAAATGHIDGPDGWLGRAIGEQELEARFDGFPLDLRLPFPPAISVISVKYHDADGVEQTFDPEGYEMIGQRVITRGTLIWPDTARRAEAVIVRYRAGYSAVPAAIKAAILLMAGDLFRNRETTAATAMNAIPMSTTVERLLHPFRVYR